MHTELFEEAAAAKMCGSVYRNWLRCYKLPKRLRWDTKPVCIGQNKVVFFCS